MSEETSIEYIANCEYKKKIPTFVKEQLNYAFSLAANSSKGTLHLPDWLTVVISSQGIDIRKSSAKIKRKSQTRNAVEKEKGEAIDKIDRVLKEMGLQFVFWGTQDFFVFNERDILGHGRLYFTRIYVDVTVILPRPLSGYFEKQFKDLTEDATQRVVRYLGYNKATDSITQDDHLFQLEDSDSTAEFYPYFDQTVSQWWYSFECSKSKLALLVGPPGTGKSDFISKCLSAHAKNNESAFVYFASDDITIQQAAFLDRVNKLKDGDLLIIEDADSLLGKRVEGNGQMAKLLNILSGTLAKDIKVIVTTNRPNLTSIDEALLRPGRTHSILEFKKLTGAQADKARQVIGKEPVGFDPDKRFTLGTALNWGEGNASEVVARLTNGPGF